MEKISFCPVVDGDDEIADPLADLKAESPVVVSFHNVNGDAQATEDKGKHHTCSEATFINLFFCLGFTDVWDTDILCFESIIMVPVEFFCLIEISDASVEHRVGSPYSEGRPDDNFGPGSPRFNIEWLGKEVGQLNRVQAPIIP